MNKTVLITGINGFIGRNLAGLLREKGYNVAGIPRSLLVNPKLLKTFIEKSEPSFILHLAAYGNHSSQTEISEIVTGNYIKSFFLLEAMANSGVSTTLVNFSSSSVYGKKDSIMCEDDTLETDSFYGATKVGVEYLCRAYSRYEGLSIITVRPFSVYGEGEATHRLIPTIINCIEKQQDLTIFPEPVHDWVYIEDFADGVLRVMEKAESLNGEVINIGSGKQYTNKHIYDVLTRISGKKPPKVVFKNSDREGDTSGVWQAEISKIRRLGWRPETTLEKGLKKTYLYYAKSLGISDDVKIPSLDEAIEESIKLVGGEWKDAGELFQSERIIEKSA